MSVGTTDKFPVNIKRRGVAAVRHFPDGCGTTEVCVSSMYYSANHRPENVRKSEIPKESLSSLEGVKCSDGLVEEEEEEEEEEEYVTGDVVVAEGDLCGVEKFVLSKRRKVPAFQGFPVGCQMGVFEVGKGPIDSSESKVFTQKYQLEKYVKSEALVLPNESLSSFEHLKGSTHNLKTRAVHDVEEEVAGDLTELEKFALRKRRRVSAVRDFPFGCGRCASKTRKGSIASSTSKVFVDVKEVGQIAFSKRKAFDEAAMDNDKSKSSVVGNVEELVVDNDKSTTFRGEKKSTATRLEGEVRRNDLNRMQPKVKQLSRAATFKSAKMRNWDVEMMHAARQREVMKGSVRVLSDAKKNDSDRIRHHAQGSSSEVRAKSLPKGSLSENTVGENRGKKLLVQSSSEKKLENHDVRRVGENLQDKASGDVNRDRVKKVLRRFRLITSSLLGDEEKSKRMLLLGKGSDSKDGGKLRRIDLKAARILKDHNGWVNQGEPIIGNVPGVEVGDEFHYRVELCIIGVHHPYQSGIDYTKRRGMLLATSVVASGNYADDVNNSDVLIYSGSGGNAMGSGDKQVRDQRLERGNLALKNSIDAQAPVRVVYGSKVLSRSDAMPKMVSTFTYDGLYLVEKYWQERGNNNFIVFKFQLRRMPGQPKVR